MGQKKESKNNDKTIWQSVVALMIIVLVVLLGSIIIILLQKGHIISGKEVVLSTIFPLGIFFLILISLLRKTKKPTLKQRKIIKILMVIILILFAFNILVFWLF